MPRFTRPWLFTIGALPAFALLSLNTFAAALAALAWGFVVFPHAADWFTRHGRARAHAGADVNAHDLSAAYWRSDNGDNGGSVGSRR